LAILTFIEEIVILGALIFGGNFFVLAAFKKFGILRIAKQANSWHVIVTNNFSGNSAIGNFYYNTYSDYYNSTSSFVPIIDSTDIEIAGDVIYGMHIRSVDLIFRSYSVIAIPSSGGYYLSPTPLGFVLDTGESKTSPEIIINSVLDFYKGDDVQDLRIRKRTIIGSANKITFSAFAFGIN
jgi:hypothetical protein